MIRCARSVDGGWRTNSLAAAAASSIDWRGRSRSTGELQLVHKGTFTVCVPCTCVYVFVSVCLCVRMNLMIYLLKLHCVLKFIPKTSDFIWSYRIDFSIYSFVCAFGHLRSAFKGTSEWRLTQASTIRVEERTFWQLTFAPWLRSRFTTWSRTKNAAHLNYRVVSRGLSE